MHQLNMQGKDKKMICKNLALSMKRRLNSLIDNNSCAKYNTIKFLFFWFWFNFLALFEGYMI